MQCDMCKKWTDNPKARIVGRDRELISKWYCPKCWNKLNKKEMKNDRRRNQTDSRKIC